MPAARAMTTHMILLVDSDNENRDFLKSEFEARNYIVLEAEDETQALDILSQETVDAVLIDLELTKVQRKSFIEKLQTSEYGNPHIVLLASPTSITREEGYDLGAAAVLSKPIDPDSLAHRLERILEPKASRWKRKSKDSSSHKISLSVDDLKIGRGGFTVTPTPENPLLEGQSIEFALEVTRKNWKLEGTGTVRYVKLDSSKRHQQTWGIEIDSLEEASMDTIMKEFSSGLPSSYIPKHLS